MRSSAECAILRDPEGVSEYLYGRLLAWPHPVTRTALSGGGDARTETGTWPRRCVSGRWLYRLQVPEVTGDRRWDGGRRPLVDLAVE